MHLLWSGRLTAALASGLVLLTLLHVKFINGIFMNTFLLWKVFLFCLPLLCLIPLYYDDVYQWYLFCTVCCYVYYVDEICSTYLLPKYLIHYVCKDSVINFGDFLFVLTTQSKIHINSEDMFFFSPFEGQAVQEWWVSNRLFWQNVQLCSNGKCAFMQRVY